MRVIKAWNRSMLVALLKRIRAALYHDREQLGARSDRVAIGLNDPMDLGTSSTNSRDVWIVEWDASGSPAYNRKLFCLTLKSRGIKYV